MNKYSEGYLWLLDPGHGGIDSDGNYTTGQKKIFDPESVFFYDNSIANINECGIALYLAHNQRVVNKHGVNGWIVPLSYCFVVVALRLL